MFAILRKSCHLHGTLPSNGILGRYLSTQEVSAALRPFYFVVHPDLFGQFPSERAVNEESLKRLSEYVTSLQVKGRSRPTELVFFIRLQNEASESFSGQIKRVAVCLSEKSLRGTILNILKCCGLSLDYVNSIPTSETDRGGSLKPFRPIKWHKSYYDATGKPNPDQHTRAHQPPPQRSLRSWLQLNIAQSRQKEYAIQHMQEDIAHLCAMLHDMLEVREIRWDSVWDISHFRGCLKSFFRLYTQHPHAFTRVLKDRTLLFSNKTGVTRLGEIVLSSEDVPTAWMRLLASVGGYDAVLERLPLMEAKLSQLLNGIRIIRQERQHSHVMAEDYELLLNKLLNSLRRCQEYVTKTFANSDLSGLEMVVDGENAPITLTSMGSFLIPGSMPGTMVVDFIQAQKEQAYIILKDIHGHLHKEAESVSRCVTTLELLELSKDETVTPQQMTRCCERLVEEYWKLRVSLHQSRIRVSHYYSVMQDGQICIPWDWIGDQNY